MIKARQWGAGQIVAIQLLGDLPLRFWKGWVPKSLRRIIGFGDVLIPRLCAKADPKRPEYILTLWFRAEFDFEALHGALVETD